MAPPRRFEPSLLSLDLLIRRIREHAASLLGTNIDLEMKFYLTTSANEGARDLYILTIQRQHLWMFLAALDALLVNSGAATAHQQDSQQRSPDVGESELGLAAASTSAAELEELPDVAILSPQGSGTRIAAGDAQAPIISSAASSSQDAVRHLKPSPKEASAAPGTAERASTPTDSEICIICLEDLSDPCTLAPCAHRFDYECIRHWLKSIYTSSGFDEHLLRCPTCRQPAISLLIDRPVQIDVLGYVRARSVDQEFTEGRRRHGADNSQPRRHGSQSPAAAAAGHPSRYTSRQEGPQSSIGTSFDTRDYVEDVVFESLNTHEVSALFVNHDGLYIGWGSMEDDNGEGSSSTPVLMSAQRTADLQRRRIDETEATGEGSSTDLFRTPQWRSWPPFADYEGLGSSPRSSGHQVMSRRSSTATGESNTGPGVTEEESSTGSQFWVVSEESSER